MKGEETQLIALVIKGKHDDTWPHLLEAKSKGEKERYTHLNAEFQRRARRDKKAFLSDQCKEIEEKHSMEKIEISSRKLEIPREHFMQRRPQ